MAKSVEPWTETGEAPGEDVRAVVSVSEVAGAIRDLLEGAFPFLRVRGEVTNLSRPQSGHLYFSLADDSTSPGASRLGSTQLPCVVWRGSAARLRFRLENGQKVVVTGRIGVYQPRGTYQLIGEHLEPAGVGELQLHFDQLKERLRLEGLFEDDRKREIPFLPRCIGLVTSPTGAAVQDLLRSILRRFPGAWVRIVPVKVQGQSAAAEVARAIRFLNSHAGGADVIVVARGGGSLEDLWAFNEEEVARALARSRVPTVSAVGHETDFTISDFVADVRAQTPTQAGELVVPDARRLFESFEIIGTRLRLAVHRQLERAEERLDRLRSSRPMRFPEALVEDLFARCDDLDETLKFHLYNRTRGWDDSLAALSARLEALSPLNVLARGYAVTRDSRGQVVQDASSVTEGQELRILLRRGSIQARVVGVEPGEPSVSPHPPTGPSEGNLLDGDLLGGSSVAGNPVEKGRNGNRLQKRRGGQPKGG